MENIGVVWYGEHKDGLPWKYALDIWSPSLLWDRAMECSDILHVCARAATCIWMFLTWCAAKTVTKVQSRNSVFLWNSIEMYQNVCNYILTSSIVKGQMDILFSTRVCLFSFVPHFQIIFAMLKEQQVESTAGAGRALKSTSTIHILLLQPEMPPTCMYTRFNACSKKAKQRVHSLRFKIVYIQF